MDLFGRRRVDREIIVLCGRRYLRYKISMRDLAEIMAEPELSLPRTTIMRWVRRFTPEGSSSAGFGLPHRQSGSGASMKRT